MANYSGKKVAVLGFGMEGRDASLYLLSQGANVTVLDINIEIKSDVNRLLGNNVIFKGGNGYLDKLSDYDYIVRSPGIYRFLPELILAENSGVIITSPIKIFFENCSAKIIGVTGTKGKGTTSTLIYEILKFAGKDVYLAGNIGKPYLELLDRINSESWVVMEMSSFQLIDLDISPHIAVVLNITSDHMDWHRDLSEYVKSKENIVLHQNESDYAVINGEYSTPTAFKDKTHGRIILFTKQSLDKKFKTDLLLRGEHNLENIAAAVAVAGVVGIEDYQTLSVVKNFKGLEHRLELVDTVKNRTFYNDSFATGPQPTIAAIKSFFEDETIILGGSEKGLDYSELGKEISATPNVKNIILIGLIREKIRSALIKAGFKGDIYDMGTSSMDEIVHKSLQITPEGGVILLSPAAASFDMFKNYKERGLKFKNAVNNLKNELS